jgi:hypothetical protein
MRTLVRLHKLGIESETERQRRMDLATVLLLTVRGIPILFYGDEQYLARYVDCDPRHPDYCDVAPEDVNTIAIQKRLDLAPGHYTGLLTQTSEVSQGNFLTVPPEGQATMYLGRLSSLVVWSQPPQP